jgi:AcrR family transcriptional regulator
VTSLRETVVAGNGRRSRRSDIVASAIRVFARQGFADASVHDVAAEAGVAPTALYYYFTGKEDLFDEALRHTLECVTELVVRTRASGDGADAEGLRRVIRAVWDWLDEHDDERRLLYHHLPGATPKASLLWQGFEEVHLQRAFDYVPGDGDDATHDEPIARHAAATLAVRTLMDLLLLIHSLRADGGPLEQQPQRQLREALADVSERIVIGTE